MIEGLISRYQYYFGENHVIDSAFYLLPLQKGLSIKKYSRRTIKPHMRINKDFLLFSEKRAKEIKNEDVKEYLSICSGRKEHEYIQKYAYTQYCAYHPESGRYLQCRYKQVIRNQLRENKGVK